MKQLFRDLFPNAKPFHVYCHDCDWKWHDGTDIKAARTAATRHAKAKDHTVAFWEAINLRPLPPTPESNPDNQLSLFGGAA